MAEKTGAYVQRVKDWKIRDMVVDYLNAREMFLECSRRFRKALALSFEDIKKISDVLYEIKENHHLIFKRLVDPRRRKFEDGHKLTPTEVEIRFMNNVGLLFHKVMVARELKYILEHYEEDSQDYHDTKKELEFNLTRIDGYFRQGMQILKALIRDHRTNVVLLSYLLENRESIEGAFDEPLEKLLLLPEGEDRLDAAYEKVRRYYEASGWLDRARQIVQTVPELTPPPPTPPMKD